MESEKLNQSICFILTHVPNPRMNKRISEFKKLMPVSVICARRASQNIWEPEHKDVEHVIIDVDLPPSSQIFLRIMASYKFRKKMYSKLLERRSAIVYSEGFDTLMLAVKYKKKYGCKLFFEVADLRESFIEKPHGIVNRVMTSVLFIRERRLFKSIDKLVITSPKFYDLHYNKLIPEDKTIYVPNAPDLGAFDHYIHKSEGVFTVGFIGGIRYLTQMKMLVDVAEILSINVLFAGAGGTNSEYAEIKEYCKGKAGIFFTGHYDYGKDIAKLYGMTDCVYSVYNADNPNVKIALPNKLYEAVYCKLPIIVAKGTYLEELVKEWGVGVSVGHKNVTELKTELSKLRDNKEYYEKIVQACEQKKADIIQMRQFRLADALLNDERG